MNIGKTGGAGFGVAVAQRGAVLVVSLLILLVMTVIGVSSMGSTTLQERMANNNNQRQIAFQAAEAALRSGEAYLVANVTGVSDLVTTFSAATPVTGMFAARAPAVGVEKNAIPASFNRFDDASWLAANNAVEVSSVTGVTRRPRFIVEYLGRVGPPLNNYSGKKQDAREYAFRITAIGWGEGASPTARYLLQSNFQMSLI